MSTYYNSVLQGDGGALKRALYKSMGFTDEALQRPIIAVVNTYTNVTPGHFGLNELTRQVELGIESAGGTAMTFGTIAPCDGIAEGHLGMRYILPSRELIASSVECMARAHRFDGLVLLGSCDKIVPGLLIAAARLDIPAIFLNGGPMLPAEYKGRHYDGNIVTEAVGRKSRGEISEEELRVIEDLAEPCIGSCAMLGTANTMGCLAEAMGMSLPGTAAIPAVYAARARAGRNTGSAAVRLVEQKITARQIITRGSIENAIRLLMAIGGSTNGILHLQAIHRAAGLGELTLETFDRISRETPQVASVYPASPYDMEDFYSSGGVPAVMRELLPLLQKDVMTVTGKTLEENGKDFVSAVNRAVIRPLEDPFAREGGVAVLIGNLAPDGSVIKPAAVPDSMQRFEGIAQVFESEQQANDAILGGQVSPGTVLVLRYEGKRGGPGMPEMYRPMKFLEGVGLADSCAIVTDGRFSGSNRGCFVGHILPEAIDGGPLAFVENGDRILIDIPARSLMLDVPQSVLEARRIGWRPPEKDVPEGWLRTFQHMEEVFTC